MNDAADRVTFVTRDGLQGNISTFEEQKRGQTHVLAVMSNGKEVWIPWDALQQREDGSYYLPIDGRDLDLVSKDRDLVIPVVEEQLHIDKRKVETGRLRIHKRISEHEEEVDEEGYEEELSVERLPVNQVLNEPAQTRYEGDTLVIPLMEEVLVIEKRLVLKEEVRITKNRRKTDHPQRVILRSEEVFFEEIDPEVDSTTDVSS